MDKIHSIAFFLRKLTFEESKMLMESIWKYGILEKLLIMIDIDNEQIRMEIMRCLINVSYKCNSEIIQKMGLHHKLMALIRISSISIIEQVINCIL